MLTYSEMTVWNIKDKKEYVHKYLILKTGYVNCLKIIKTNFSVHVFQ